MINSIYIKDYAIIDELRVDFKDNLSIFIGETGAGKSIIIGALGFLCGQRADSSIIKKDKTKAIIEGCFSLNDNIKEKLDNLEIEYDDEIVVYRTIASDGKNIIRINNRTVTLAILNDILGQEIDIHSQKDAQYLLKPQNHLALLDIYLNRFDLLNEVDAKYRNYKRLVNEYDEYLSANDSINDIEYYKYQINEIEEANLSKDEEDELMLFEKRYKSFQKLINKLSRAISLYESEDGINNKLFEVVRELNSDDDQINNISNTINNSYYELDEAFNNLKKILKDINISESEINNNQERLFIINKLKRKYKMDIDNILRFKDELTLKVEAFENRQSLINKYEKDIKNSYDDYLKSAHILHEERIKAAKYLSKDVIEEMDGLELRYFDFKVNVLDNIESSKGIDDVSFLISTNKGEQLKPLIKVASGGEMSRILLGLKAIFAKISNINICVFDEIDTGVSGKAALAIGKKMAKISKYSQVLAITHLAQVASFGDVIYYVSKKEVDGHTTSSLTQLNESRIIEELALMANSNISESTLKSASELIVKAKEIKESL